MSAEDEDDDLLIKRFRALKASSRERVDASVVAARPMKESEKAKEEDPEVSLTFPALEVSLASTLTLLLLVRRRSLPTLRSSLKRRTLARTPLFRLQQQTETSNERSRTLSASPRCGSTSDPPQTQLARPRGPTSGSRKRTLSWMRPTSSLRLRTRPSSTRPLPSLPPLRNQ